VEAEGRAVGIIIWAGVGEGNWKERGTEVRTVSYNGRSEEYDVTMWIAEVVEG
jgi:hypothetical protein